MKTPVNESPNSSATQRKIRLTRLGAHFLFVACFAMFGGALRGFNLLLVVAGLLIGAVWMQWRWSRAALVSLSVKRRLPDEVFAGQPFTALYELSNHSRWLTFSMLRLEDHGAPLNQVSHGVHPHISIRKLRRTETITYRHGVGPLRRGQWTFGPLAVTTTFPLDLMTSHIGIRTREPLLVFPRLVPLRRGWQQILASRRGGSGSASQRAGRGEGVFFGLREWQHGDKLRWIHWRTTARMNEPVVCQYDRPRRYDLCLLLDAFSAAEDDSAAEAEDVETAISVVASIMLSLAAENSNRVVLAACGKNIVSAPSSGSIENQKRLLKLLAMIEPTDSPRLVDAIEDAAKLGRIKDIVVISPRSQKAAFESMNPATRSQLDQWTRRGLLRWIDVSNQETQIAEDSHHA